MCLAVPGRVLETYDERGTPMAIVDFDGIRKEICLVYLPDVAIGAYAAYTRERTTGRYCPLGNAASARQNRGCRGFWCPFSHYRIRSYRHTGFPLNDDLITMNGNYSKF